MIIFILTTMLLIVANRQHELEKFSVVKNVDIYGGSEPKKHNNIWKKAERSIQVVLVAGLAWKMELFDAAFFAVWCGSFHFGFFDGLLNVYRTGKVKDFFKKSYKDKNKILDILGIIAFVILTFIHFKIKTI